MDYWYEQYKLACEIAEVAHKGQFRFDGVTPYIEHPRAVADQFDGLMKKSIAMLHDVIEDCDGYDQARLVEMGVDPVIADCVNILTHVKGETYREYIERVCEYELPIRIKLADMIVNLADKPTERQKKKYLKFSKILFANL